MRQFSRTSFASAAGKKPADMNMPVEVENKLKAEAKKKRVKDVNAYVYGTMQKLGLLNRKPANPSKEKSK